MRSASRASRATSGRPSSSCEREGRTAATIRRPRTGSPSGRPSGRAYCNYHALLLRSGFSNLKEARMPDRDPEELFLRVIDEKISRGTLLRRGLATGVGLTILSSPLDAFARGSKSPPLRGQSISMKELIAEAKKEGKLNTIALPPDWANYGEIISTFQKKYKIGITNDNPNGSSADENQAVRSLKGDPRAPDVLDVGISFAVLGANERLYARYFNRNFKTIPRSL